MNLFPCIPLHFPFHKYSFHPQIILQLGPWPLLLVYVTSTWLTMTGLGRPWSGEQMELRGRPNNRPRVGDSEVGDRGRPSSCVLEPLQKGQLIRDLFLLKDFCWPGSADRKKMKL